MSIEENYQSDTIVDMEPVVGFNGGNVTRLTDKEADKQFKVNSGFELNAFISIN